jgi:hypothetical protein
MYVYIYSRLCGAGILVELRSASDSKSEGLEFESPCPHISDVCIGIMRARRFELPTF